MLTSKCLNNFCSQFFINFTGSLLYVCPHIICHSLFYFAIHTYINELQCPAPTSKNISQIISGSCIIFGLTVKLTLSFKFLPGLNCYVYIFFVVVVTTSPQKNV